MQVAEPCVSLLYRAAATAPETLGQHPGGGPGGGLRFPKQKRTFPEARCKWPAPVSLLQLEKGRVIESAGL